MRGIAPDATKLMLPLIWHKEAGVQRSFAAVFYKLYLDPETFDQDLSKLVDNLLNLVENLTA